MTKKEKRAEYMREYYSANRDKLLNRQKVYAANNKDKVSVCKGLYYKKNKEKISLSIKSYDDKKKLDYYVVYALPNFNNTSEVYCGISSNIYRRMVNHKATNKNTEDWFILDVVKDKEEALSIERNYHDNGYKGINNKYINK